MDPPTGHPSKRTGKRIATPKPKAIVPSIELLRIMDQARRREEGLPEEVQHALRIIVLSGNLDQALGELLNLKGEFHSRAMTSSTESTSIRPQTPARFQEEVERIEQRGRELQRAEVDKCIF